jgi:hypothetical protein
MLAHIFLCLLVRSEYFARGQVSTRTDAFAYGIIMVELLTGLDPVSARELVDDSLFEELPEMIRERHDRQGGSADVSGAGAGAGAAAKALVRKCAWPAEHLKALSLIAAKAVRAQPKRRATLVELLPEVEALSWEGFLGTRQRSI